MTEHAHNSVAAATWPWRDRETKNADTAARKRRHRILLQTAVGLSAGAVMLLLHWNRMGTIAVCIASVVFAVGCIVPRFYDALDGSIIFGERFWTDPHLDSAGSILLPVFPAGTHYSSGQTQGSDVQEVSVERINLLGEPFGQAP